MAWLEKRGAKTLVIWREADGSRRSKSFPDKASARTFKAEVELKLLTGAYTPAADRKEPLGPYIERLVSEDLSLREATRRNQLSVVRIWISPELGHHELGAVTEDHVRSLFAKMHSAGQSPASIQKVRAVLSKAFTTAIRRGALVRNPVSAVAAPRGARRQLRVLAPEEVDKLAGVIEPRYRALVILAAYSGLRTGELGALRLENIDFLNRRIRVVEAISGKGRSVEVHDPKTDAGRRTVAVPAFVMDELARHVQLYPPMGGRVFSTASGNVLESSNLFPAWNTARRRAGLPDVHFHDLRHTSVAFAIQMGAHPKEIQTRLGHAQIAMTLDLYGHLFPGMDDDLATRMDAAYGGERKVVAIR